MLEAVLTSLQQIALDKPVKRNYNNSFTSKIVELFKLKTRIASRYGLRWIGLIGPEARVGASGNRFG
jgi:hypothetical protein